MKAIAAGVLASFSLPLHLFSIERWIYKGEAGYGVLRYDTFYGSLTPYHCHV